MILMPLLIAAEKLQADPFDMRQVQALQEAVANCPRYFDDSGWPATRNPAHAMK